jgi:hypothetical protein
MVITVSSELERALTEQARRQGVSPEAVALTALRDRFLAPPAPLEPRDEWERRLRQIATDCGVSLANDAVSSEGIYE